MPSIKPHESKNMGRGILVFLLLFLYRRVLTKGHGKEGPEIAAPRELLGTTWVANMTALWTAPSAGHTRYMLAP